MAHHQTAIALISAALVMSAADVKEAARRESVDVLKRATARMVANSDAQQSLTCVETIQRVYYHPLANTLPRYCPQLMEQRQHPSPDLKLLTWMQDRLRLEVASSARGEIYSWPGASRFSDGDIATLIHSGPIGTGPFGVMLNLIFMRDVKSFVIADDSVVDGRRCLSYKFAVSVENSHFLVKSINSETWVPAAYEGIVHVDPETADPIEMTVVSNSLPPAAGMCQTSSTQHFKRNKMGDDDVLLADTTKQRFVGATGAETETAITFSACRQYSAESTVSFYAAEPSPGTPARVVKPNAVPKTIPVGVSFSMELLTPIDSDTAAEGDRFTARLKEPLLDGPRLIAPKGALVEGRVSDVKVAYKPDMSVTIGLLPQTLEIRGVKTRFTARLDFRPKVVAKERKKQKGLDFALPSPGEYANQFELPGARATLSKGFVSDWVTALPRR